MLRLRSSDGELFEVDMELARSSATIRTMLEDQGIEHHQDQEVVQLPAVNSALLRKVIQWSTQNSSLAGHKDQSHPNREPLVVQEAVSISRPSLNRMNVLSTCAGGLHSSSSSSLRRSTTVQPGSNTANGDAIIGGEAFPFARSKQQHNNFSGGSNLNSNSSGSGNNSASVVVPSSSLLMSPNQQQLLQNTTALTSNCSAQLKSDAISDNGGNCAIEAASNANILSSPAAAAAASAATEEGLGFKPSPEILFLVREQAKTFSALNSICKRLKSLETSVCDMKRNVSQLNSNRSSKSASIELAEANCSAKGATSSSNPLVLSDDSGGEYSRTTNGTNVDDDELLSLLDQIAKCSQQIQQQAHGSQQQYLVLNSLTNGVQNSSTPIHHQNHHRSSNGPVQSAMNALYNNTTESSLLGSTRQLTLVPSMVSGREGLKLHHVHLPTAPPQTLAAPPLLQNPLNPSISRQLQRTNQNSSAGNHNPSSLSALLDPSVDRFLSTLQNELTFGENPSPSDKDHHISPDGSTLMGAAAASSSSNALISTPYSPYASPMAGALSCSFPAAASSSSLSPSSQLHPNHHQQSQQHLFNHPPSAASSSASVAADNWRIERFRQIVRQREQEEAESQMILADQWLASQLKKSAAVQQPPPPPQQSQRHHQH